MPGVHVGDGAIIATRSVVTKHVPPYAVVGGNPARVLKMRFSEEDITVLQELAWWNWSAERITRHLTCIASGDVRGLLQAVKEEMQDPQNS